MNCQTPPRHLCSNNHKHAIKKTSNHKTLTPYPFLPPLTYNKTFKILIKVARHASNRARHISIVDKVCTWAGQQHTSSKHPRLPKRWLEQDNRPIQTSKATKMLAPQSAWQVILGSKDIHHVGLAKCCTLWWRGVHVRELSVRVSAQFKFVSMPDFAHWLHFSGDTYQCGMQQ